MPGQNKPELAYKGAIFKTIPSARATVAVTTSSQQTSLTAYGGKWVWLRALTADITILRGTHTLTAGNGFVLRVGADPIDFFIDPDDTDKLTLAHIAGANATLEILYDD